MLFLPNHVTVPAYNSKWWLWQLVTINTSCNAECGKGFETWIRECNKPKPKYGGRNCSHLGESVKHRPCLKMPCIGKTHEAKINLSSKTNNKFNSYDYV